jgi:hypothetical protein
MGACITVFRLNLENIYFANENKKAFLKQRRKALFEKKTKRLLGKALKEKVNAKLNGPGGRIGWGGRLLFLRLLRLGIYCKRQLSRPLAPLP